VHVEARIGGSWIDLIASKDVRHAGAVAIRRGLSGEGSTAEPSRCDLVLDNRDGLFSARNPRSAYYGQLGRNTPMRVSVDAATAYLAIDATTGVPPAGGAYVSTPDASALDITGDIDVRFDADLDSWRSDLVLISKWTSASGQRSYQLVLGADGLIGLLGCSDGGAAVVNSTCRLPVPVISGRIAVRVTLDADNGAGGRTVTFYTAPTIAGPWVQLGPARTPAGTLAIFASTAPLRLLADPAATDYGVWHGRIVRGRVYAAQVRAGIDGTLVADFDPSGLAHGVASWTDSVGRTWTPVGACSVSRRDWRWHGEVAAWPIAWDTSGRDVHAPISGAGVMRRLGGTASVLRSTLYRASVALASLRGYWPMEDGDRAEQLGSALDAGQPATWVGDLHPSTDTTFVASDALPMLNGAKIEARVPPYSAASTSWQVRCLVSVPAGGAPTSSIVLRVATVASSIGRWDVTYGTGGTLAVSWWDREGDLIGTSGAIGFNVDGRPLRLSLEVAASGSNVAWSLITLGPGDDVGGSYSDTVSGQVAGRVRTVILNSKRQMQDVAVGHVTVQSIITTFADVRQQLAGYEGETAGARIQRLCNEEGISAHLVGTPGDTEAMGPQRPGRLLDLLRECAAVDGGQLYEPGDALAVAYRTRSALLAQPVRASIPYGMLRTLAPVEDDSATANDITVVRPTGSSARAVQTTGPMSTADPVAGGVGRYSTQLDLNTSADARLGDLAGWARALGTIDEPRYPEIGTNITHPRLDAATRAALLALDVGDRLTVTGPPVWLPPEDISQMVIGLAETIRATDRDLTLVTVPDTPYRQVAAYSGLPAWGSLGIPPTGGRYSSDGSTLASGVSSSATSWSIATPDGPLWTTDPAYFPLDWMVAGEQVRVTAISGTSSPQTATVVRAVNGISKAHATATPVELFTPARYR
jgi:hypothetical protein